MERATRARRVVLFVAAAAAAAAVIGGIISSQATAASPTPGTSASGGAGKVVLKIGWMEPPDNMNPFIGWSNTVYEIYYLEYLKLAGRDIKTMKPQPGEGLAKSWEVSPDGLTWTFKINQGITWNDGVPVTAEDVAFTFNFNIDNDIGMFSAAIKYVKKAVVVDPYTVKIICTRPQANLLTATMFILPEHIWSKMDPTYATMKFQNPPPVIGDGPFQVVEWKRNAYVRLVANKNFHVGSVGPPKIDELLFVLYQNADSMVEDLKAGSLDAAYLVPEAQYEPLKNTPGVAVAKYTWFNWDYLGFNCYTGKSHGNPVLRDQRFRAALEYAIDRQQIVDVAYYGYAIPGYTFMPPGDWKDPDYSWLPPDGVRRDFDLAKANQLLDEAGYKMGPNGIRLDKQGKPIVLRLWATNASPENQRSARLIAAWFRQVGVDTKLGIYDDGVYIDRLCNYDGDTFAPDFDMYLWSWDGGSDPGQTLNYYTTAQIEENNNESAWSNKEFDRLDEVQSSTMDPNQRAAVIKQMQQVLYQDSPCIVLAHPYKLCAYRTDKWTGWQRANYGAGPAFAASLPYLYQNLEPKTAAASGGGSSSTLTLVIVVVAVVVAVAAFVLVRRSRRARREEE